MVRHGILLTTTLLALAAAGCASPSLPIADPSPALRAFAGADSLHSRPLATGVLHIRAWEREGPWAIHIIEVDTARCAPRWSARKPPGTLDARATTSSLAGGALAAINADFFQLPGGTPVGPHVTGGRVLIGPGAWPAWLWDGQSMASGEAILEGMASAGGDSIRLAQVNRAVRTTSSYRPPPQGATLFTALAPVIPPADSAADVVLFEVETGDERAGSGRVLRVERDRTDTLRLAPGQGALQLWGEARAWAARRTAGQPVRWQARVLAAAGPALACPGAPPPGGCAGAQNHDRAGPWPALEAVGGFPLLLHEGKDVLTGTPVTTSFAQRHPRTAIGWSEASGRVFLVAVDGRQPPYSDGMTLVELLGLFRRLGASEAINLDGGGSTAVVVLGVVQNRPSDREGERAVGNALLLAACDRRDP